MMKLRYGVVIFDLDGTLLDTLDDLADSVNFVLHENGFPIRTRDEIRRFVGNGVRLLVERALPENCSDQTREACFAQFVSHYTLHKQDKTRPYPEVLDLLASLRARGCRIGIVSNKYDAAVKALAEDFFPGLIDVAIGESPNVQKKPAPDSVFAALRALDADTDTAIYVGDSEVDIETARNCGIPCISVSWGFRSKDLLTSCGAEHVIDRPMELLSLL